MAEGAQTWTTMHVVRFEVGAQVFALDVMAVQEVLQPRMCEAVPGQPAFIEGLIELRGQYLPLIDLRKRFAMEPTTSETSSLGAKLLIVKSRDRNLALIVDAVGVVERIEPDRLRKPPMDNSIGAPGSLLAVAQTDSAMVLVLAGDALLSESEISSLPG